MSREIPIVRHEQRPLSFSDQPGYTLTHRGHLRDTHRSSEVPLLVECVERIGWWQQGWLVSLFQTPAPTVSRRFTGRYVWHDDDTGERVCLNLESGLITLLCVLEGTD